MPLYVRSGSGLTTSDYNRSWFARTISPCRAGTRSTSTPPLDQRQGGPGGTRRSPSSTSASYMSRERTTLWQIASVDGPTPRARLDGHIEPWGRQRDQRGQAHHRDGEGQGTRGSQVLCGDGKPYRPGQVPGRPSPSHLRGNPRAMDGGPCRASQVGAYRRLVG